MRTVYSRRQYQPSNTEEKLRVARALVGKQVVIEGVPRTVTGVAERSGEAEIRIGIRTQLYDPLKLTVVER